MASQQIPSLAHSRLSRASKAGLSIQNPIAHRAGQPSALSPGLAKDAGVTGRNAEQVSCPLTNVHSRSHSSPPQSACASRSMFAARFSTHRMSHARTAVLAQRCSSSFDSIRRSFSDVSGLFALKAGASDLVGGLAWAHQKGSVSFNSRAFTFAPVHSVTQRVIRSIFSIEAPMDQLELRLMCRLDAPSVVPASAIASCKTYREAVRLCWDLRRASNMTKRTLAELAGLYAPHVSCYLSDAKNPRDLPAEYIKAFEIACNNSAISQWLAQQSQLTVLEELQMGRAAA